MRWKRFAEVGRLTLQVGGSVQLDGTWSFQAQFKALGACNQEAPVSTLVVTNDDWSFKENSVKEVTDRGRKEGITRLQGVLAECSERAPEPKKRKIKDLDNEDDQKILEALGEAELELRRNVKALLAPLKELEKHRGEASDGAALAIFRQLRRLNVTVDTLKATRIAAELNKPCWRGSQASSAVRSAATALIKNWRSMYRSETGQLDEKSDASKARRVRLLAVDLEEKVFDACHKMGEYCRVIELLCQELDQCRDTGDNLLQGNVSGHDLVTKSIGRFRLRARAVKDKKAESSR
ncbi:unnamed protein product [Effrenium voratum]|nr:unnamed protein product [Effrenium voratum]